MVDTQTTYTWKGRGGPFELVLSEHTFPPSSISLLLGEAIDVEAGESVLDIGCGSGVLGIIAAQLGAGHVTGIDAAPDTAEVGQLNAERLGVGDRTRFLHGDLFDPLADETTFDLIIGDVSGIPDEFARISGWFPDGRGGGPTGVELPQRMLEEATARLNAGGRLLLPTGSIQDEASLLATAREHFTEVEQVGEKRFPLPQKLAEAPELRRLVDDGVIELTPRGSRMLWYARVWRCAGA